MAFKFFFFAALVGLSSGAGYQSAASAGQIAYAESVNYDNGPVNQEYSPQAPSYVVAQPYRTTLQPVSAVYNQGHGHQGQAQPQYAYKSVASSPRKPQSYASSSRLVNRYAPSPKYTQTHQVASYSHQAPVAYAHPSAVVYASGSAPYAEAPHAPQRYQQAVQAAAVQYVQAPEPQVSYVQSSAYIQPQYQHVQQAAQPVYAQATVSYQPAHQQEYAYRQQVYAHEPQVAQVSQVSYAHPQQVQQVQQVAYSHIPQAVAYVQAKPQEDDHSAHESSHQYSYSHFGLQDAIVDESKTNDKAAEASQTSYALVDPSDSGSEYSSDDSSSDYRASASTTKSHVSPAPYSSDSTKTSHSSTKSSFTPAAAASSTKSYYSNKPYYSPQISKYSPSLAQYYAYHNY